MPSAIITSIFKDADNLLNQTLFGESVIYTFFRTGLSKPITMRIDRGVNLGRDKSSNVALNFGATDAVSYQALGFPSVLDVPNPEYLDIVTSTGPGGNEETWTVLAAVQSDSSTHTISLRSDMRPQI